MYYLMRRSEHIAESFYLVAVASFLVHPLRQEMLSIPTLPFYRFELMVMLLPTPFLPRMLHSKVRGISKRHLVRRVFPLPCHLGRLN